MAKIMETPSRGGGPIRLPRTGRLFHDPNQAQLKSMKKPAKIIAVNA
jgi:hypothetical protein